MPDKLEWKQAPSSKSGVMQTILTAYQPVQYGNGAAGRLDIGQLCIYRELNGTLDISRIQVRPEVRKLGLATALMQRMFDLADAGEAPVSKGFTGEGSAIFHRIFKVECTDRGTAVPRK